MCSNNLENIFLIDISEKKFKKLSQNRQNQILRDWLEKIILNPEVLSDPFFLTNFLSPQYLKLLRLMEKQPDLDYCKPDNLPEVFETLYHFHHQQLNDFQTDYPMQHEDKDIADILQYKGPKVKWSVLLDNIRSAYNVGSIIRTMDGAGWDTVYTTGITAPLDNEKVKKSSMGASQWIKQERIENLDTFLKNKKIVLVALETNPKKEIYYDEYEWKKSGILVLGHEVNGIQKKIRDRVDEIISIPMYGLKNSLNVSNAFSILSYHITSVLHKSKK